MHTRTVHGHLQTIVQNELAVATIAQGKARKVRSPRSPNLGHLRPILRPARPLTDSHASQPIAHVICSSLPQPGLTTAALEAGHTLGWMC